MRGKDVRRKKILSQKRGPIEKNWFAAYNSTIAVVQCTIFPHFSCQKRRPFPPDGLLSRHWTVFAFERERQPNCEILISSTLFSFFG